MLRAFQGTVAEYHREQDAIDTDVANREFDMDAFKAAFDVTADEARRGKAE